MDDRPLIFRPLPLPPPPKPRCSHFASRGACKHGERCKFAHDAAGDSCEEQARVRAEENPRARRSQFFWLYKMPRDATEYQLLVDTLAAHGFRRAENDAERQQAVLLWSGSAKAPSPIPPLCAVNRLGLGKGGGTWLTHKDRLASSLRQGRQSAVAPLTFTLPHERPALRRHCDEQRGAQAIWIVKLARNGRSRGTFVTRNVESISEKGECVVCEYIQRPLLVQGHKHDLRLYVVVFPSTPVRAFMYSGGYVRFAAKEFSLADIEEGGTWDPFVHLTYLDSIDRRQHRIQREKEWTVQQLFEYLGEHPDCGPERAAGLWRDIKELAGRTVSCLPQALLQRSKDSRQDATSQCRQDNTAPTAFELFGFDVLVDAELRPWLLEVNGQPHLGSSSKNGAFVFASEHVEKAGVIAGTLSMALAGQVADLDQVAADVGFEPLHMLDFVGEDSWARAGAAPEHACLN